MEAKESVFDDSRISDELCHYFHSPALVSSVTQSKHLVAEKSFALCLSVVDKSRKRSEKQRAKFTVNNPLIDPLVEVETKTEYFWLLSPLLALRS